MLENKEIKKAKKGKKAQEEMVGFVLIIVIVAVVALFFLAIQLRKSISVEEKSKEVSNFLASLVQYSSDCELGFTFIDIKDLIGSCVNGRMCQDGRTSCQAMDSETEKIIDETWTYGKEKIIKGYMFKIDMVEGNITQSLKTLNKGNCSIGVKKGADTIFPIGTTTARVELKVCY